MAHFSFPDVAGDGRSLVTGVPLADEPGMGALTIPGYLREVTARHGDREALVLHRDDGVVRWSYRQLLQQSMAVARAPTGSNKNAPPPVSGSAVCWARIGCVATSATATTRLESRSLIDEHDGNTVVNGIDEPAFVADELFIRFGLILQLILTFWTDKYLQQILRESHLRLFPFSGVVVNPNIRSICGDLRQLECTFTQRSRYTR